MLAPGLVPAVCSSNSVIGGRETLFDEDVLHHQRDRRCRPGSWSNSMHSRGPHAGHVSRSDRMIHRRRTHVALDRILGPARRRHTGNHRNRHRLVSATGRHAGAAPSARHEAPRERPRALASANSRVVRSRSRNPVLPGLRWRVATGSDRVMSFQHRRYVMSPLNSTEHGDPHRARTKLGSFAIGLVH